MKTLDYVKNHIGEFEEDYIFDRRFTKRFIEFLHVEEWEQFGFGYCGEGSYVPKEWTEENILVQLKRDVEFGYQKAINERGLSSGLMCMVVRAWCKVLENGLELDDDGTGYYSINQFTSVAEHYGWELN